ncbi:hypothetical protein GCM10022222_67690 [Amycolatopsis ultiminotia]|uniref:Uncharacterized protein n=1 Tax=Amycolatopsis ultiminotia TaxID=543629 RepID=A0ABP6XY75_9PSEU
MTEAVGAGNESPSLRFRFFRSGAYERVRVGSGSPTLADPPSAFNLIRSEPYKPKTLTQRYNRPADRLGINTTIRCVRHYAATEPIVAGVDIRAVAGPPSDFFGPGNAQWHAAGHEALRTTPTDVIHPTPDDSCRKWAQV